MIDHKSNYGQIGIRSGHCPLDSIFNCNWRLQYTMDSLDIQFHPLQKSHFNPISSMVRNVCCCSFFLSESNCWPPFSSLTGQRLFSSSHLRENQNENQKRLRLVFQPEIGKDWATLFRKKAFLVINYSGKFWWEARASIMEAAIATFQATNGEST